MHSSIAHVSQCILNRLHRFTDVSLGHLTPLHLAAGWRPRRTLVFASWGSGEFGYYGATELVEEFITLIGGRTVAYLNVDLAIIYTYNLFVVATPLLQNVTAEAAKQVTTARPPPTLSQLQGRGEEGLSRDSGLGSDLPSVESGGLDSVPVCQGRSCAVAGS